VKQTGIEFADSSWNPIRGCKWKSEACTNCWAAAIAGRYAKLHQTYYRVATMGKNGHPKWNGEVEWIGEKFWDPLEWQDQGESRRIVVCSMSDLFYPKIRHEWRDAIFGLISLCAEHTFLVQTKYAAEMRQYFSTPGVWARIEQSARRSYKEYWRTACPSKGRLHGPLANTWLGVSVEDQGTADERIPILQDTPAALRYVDAHPLLGEVTLDKYLGDKLDWVIAGGESGMWGRPCNPEWIRQLKRECNDHQIAFFMDKWGTWMPITREQLEERGWQSNALHTWPNGEISVKLIRSDIAGGPKEWQKVMEELDGLVDGEEWQQLPEFEKQG
jgi:protein gp37